MKKFYLSVFLVAVGLTSCCQFFESNIGADSYKSQFIKPEDEILIDDYGALNKMENLEELFEGLDQSRYSIEEFIETGYMNHPIYGELSLFGTPCKDDDGVDDVIAAVYFQEGEGLTNERVKQLIVNKLDHYGSKYEHISVKDEDIFDVNVTHEVWIQTLVEGYPYADICSLKFVKCALIRQSAVKSNTYRLSVLLDSKSRINQPRIKSACKTMEYSGTTYPVFPKTKLTQEAFVYRFMYY